MAEQKRGVTGKRRPPDAWDKEAQRLIRSAMKLHGYTYKSLRATLEGLGYDESDSALSLRVNRGSFSMGFALRVLRAMNVKVIEISHIPMHREGKKPKPGG